MQTAALGTTTARSVETNRAGTHPINNCEHISIARHATPDPCHHHQQHHAMINPNALIGVERASASATPVSVVNAALVGSSTRVTASTSDDDWFHSDAFASASSHFSAVHHQHHRSLPGTGLSLQRQHAEGAFLPSRPQSTQPQHGVSVAQPQSGHSNHHYHYSSPSQHLHNPSPQLQQPFSERAYHVQTVGRHSNQTAPMSVVDAESSVAMTNLGRHATVSMSVSGHHFEHVEGYHPHAHQHNANMTVSLETRNVSSTTSMSLRSRGTRSSTTVTAAISTTQMAPPRTLSAASHRESQRDSSGNRTTRFTTAQRHHNIAITNTGHMEIEDSNSSDRENWADVDEYHDVEEDASDAMSDVEHAEGEDAEYNEEDEDVEEEDEDVDDYGEHVPHADQQQSQAENDERAKELQEQQLELRKQIQQIQADPSLSGAEKAKRVQELMTRRWTNKVQKETHREVRYINRLANKKKDFSIVTEEDRQKSFYAPDILGCKHYQRSAKIQAHCCGKWDPCRFCHDEVSDHTITRNLVMTMMCMHCWTVQPAGQDCINPDCGKRVARYYCKECKLWDDDPRKTIYHCYDCGICRIGKGLGIDYFHCPTCNVCMAIGLKGRHKCIERNLESDCPICGEYMFTSTSTVIFMPCGHCMHHKCHQQYIQTSYQCPTCLKSLADMTDYFRRIDNVLSQHQMPPEYSDTFSYIYCNDCEKKSYAKFHFIYHKCAFCRGYNTKLLQTRTGLPPDAPIAQDLPPAPIAQQAQIRSDASEIQGQPSGLSPVQLEPRALNPHHDHSDTSQGSASSSSDHESVSQGLNISSGVSAGDSRSFWCHRCQLPTQLFQDGATLRCVTCSSDFVEEL